MKPFVLSIKFTTKPDNKEAFKRSLVELFEEINHEPSFINAVLHEGAENTNEILVYETWDETVNDFMKVQMAKPYRAPFEQLLKDLEINREVGLYYPFLQWGK